MVFASYLRHTPIPKCFPLVEVHPVFLASTQELPGYAREGGYKQAHLLAVSSVSLLLGVDKLQKLYNKNDDCRHKQDAVMCYWQLRSHLLSSQPHKL